MRYDVFCPACRKTTEIAKAMTDPLPQCEKCGGEVKQKYTAPQVVYAAGGFYATDVKRFESQVGKERYAKYQAQLADVQKRAKQGKLTPYEKSFEQ